MHTKIVGLFVRPEGLLVGAAFLWGANLTISKSILEVLTPLQLMAYRWVPALVIILILAIRFEGLALPRTLKGWMSVSTSALFGAAGYSYFLYLALQHLSPNHIAVIGALNPVIIVGASALIFRTEIRPRETIGIGVAILGVLIMFAGPSLLHTDTQSATFYVGLLAMTGALTAWTIFTLIGSRSSTPPLTSTAIQAALTICFSTALLAGLDELTLPDMTVAQWLSFSYVAIGATTIAFVLWLTGTQRHGASRSAPYLNLVPIFGVIVGVAAGFHLSVLEGVGAAVTVIGTAISTRQIKKRPN